MRFNVFFSVFQAYKATAVADDKIMSECHVNLSMARKKKMPGLDDDDRSTLLVDLELKSANCALYQFH